MVKIVIAIIILSILAIHFMVKTLTYFCAFSGLLYYLMSKYNDEPSDETLKELTLEAAKHINWKKVLF